MKKSYCLIITLCLSTTAIFAQIDYSTDIQPIFTTRCSGCHGAGQNTFNSSSYDAVMASTSASNKYNSKHVIPSNAAGSPLVDKIEPNPQFGTQMPQGGALSQTDVDKIKDWINEGANSVATSNEQEINSPSDFKLIGNYPNPFNPTTQIQFEVPVATQYTISVYSIQGQLVSEQVGNVSAGRAQVAVNLGVNPSGMYIYKVSAFTNGVSQLIGTGRMSLIK